MTVLISVLTIHLCTNYVRSSKVFYYKFGKVSPPKGSKESPNIAYNGTYDPSTNTITLSSAIKDNKITFALTCAEESYHALQSSLPDIGTNIEYEAHTFALFHNFNKGSLFIPNDFANTDYSDFDKYYDSSGKFNTKYFTNDFYVRNGDKFIDYYSSSVISAYKTPVNQFHFVYPY